MPELFNLSLGGISLSLAADKPTGNYEFIRRASEFITSDAPDVSLQVHCGWFPELEDARPTFITDKGLILFQSGDQWVIKYRSATQDPYQLGVFPADFSSGDIYVAQSITDSNRYVFPLSYPMGELYLMGLLSMHSGMLFHASGVIDHGNAYLFSGYSGAGKTTTARLWDHQPGVRVVNDDKVIIRKKPDGFYLYGTPWHGEGGITSPDSAPLKHVFVLKHAPYNYETKLQPAQAASNLLARAFTPLWDAQKMANILIFLDELCQTVPCGELGFVNDPRIVNFIQNLA